MHKFAAAGVLAALLTLTAAAPGAAEPFSAEAARSRTITVPRNKSLSFRLDTPASKIVVAQPETAQIVATTDRSFYVRGKELGSTNLLVYGAGGQLMEVIDVRVGYDAEALKADLSAALPGETIQVSNLGEGLLLSGEVSNTSAAARALSLAERIAPKAVTSALTVRASQQVVLEVRVLEASREALKEFGINIEAGGSRFALQTGSGLLSGTAPTGQLAVRGTIGQSYIDVVLRALEEKNVIRTLARPNLVALSGAKASFLAGGEFPFPIPADDDTLAIEFREYGVKLDFEPTVQDNGLIRMRVAPEVSQLDPRGGIQVMGVQIPGLTSRKTETTVELRDGESLAIAGLFQEDYVNAVRDLPGVSEVPVLGALFRSSRWRRQETELVIIVTPRLATAGDLSPDKPEMLAGDEKSLTELILTGKALDKPLNRGRKAGR